MKTKRIVAVDIRSGQPRITITRVGGEGQPIVSRERIATLKSFDHVVRVCTAHPHFGFTPNGFDRWTAIER
jgi:hypothetical protein